MGGSGQKEPFLCPVKSAHFLPAQDEVQYFAKPILISNEVFPEKGIGACTLTLQVLQTAFLSPPCETGVGACLPFPHFMFSSSKVWGRAPRAGVQGSECADARALHGAPRGAGSSADSCTDFSDFSPLLAHYFSRQNFIGPSYRTRLSFYS